MKFKEVLKLAKNYSNVLFLNRILPPFLREVIIVVSFGALVVVSLLLLVLEIELRYFVLIPEHRDILMYIVSYKNLIIIATGIFFSVHLIVHSLDMYSRYYTLMSIERVFVDNSKRLKVSYEVGCVLIRGEEDGFVNGLLSIPESSFILNRLQIDVTDISSFGGDEVVVTGDEVVPEYNETVTLGSLWKLLYENCETFRKGLLSKKIQKEIFYDTCDWLDRNLEDSKRSDAWWWRENLSKIRGIAKSLSYGDAHFISKYARELGVGMDIDDAGKVLLHKDSIKNLEEALSKKYGGNALIVGAEGSGRNTIIKTLAKMIDQGNCYSEIEYKRVFEFDNTILKSLDSVDFINTLNLCFKEAIQTKNIILVINDFDSIFETAQKEGVDAFQILERYSTHEDVSLVCICSQLFYQNETHKNIFDNNFEIIHIGDIDSKLLIPYIQDHVAIVESVTGKFFPSQSIAMLANTLGKYFIEDSPLVKTSDLLYKIATNNHDANHIIIDEERVSDTVKTIIGISTGKIQEEEKDRLINLEELLHKKIVGQNEAIKAIASTMRRSRAGLVKSNKPIGSFLFLGPTGVGKTETAKSLAEVFFGNEEYMSRIDMNEYTMSDSSHKLLGGDNYEGDIATLIHRRPYGVLLLDEFEKSTTDVKDLFLRILDEGLFVNGSGKTTSARTQIIIATSNAGSDYIRESGLSLNSTKKEIDEIKNKLINHIIENNLFRPELINRFDAVILFHPLGSDSQILVAKKMLDALHDRSLAQGYDVVFTDALVQKIVHSEDGVVFNGRTIQRNIQMEVEEVLAKKIIENSLQIGDTIIIDADDVE